MSDIGNVCDYCPDEDCKRCPFANPCLGCDDYDESNDRCKSNGGCGATKGSAV